jgi:hypothetical protein
MQHLVAKRGNKKMRHRSQMLRYRLILGEPAGYAAETNRRLAEAVYPLSILSGWHFERSSFLPVRVLIASSDFASVRNRHSS